MIILGVNIAVQDAVIASNAIVTACLLVKELLAYLDKKPKLSITFNPNHYNIKPGVNKMGRERVYPHECMILLRNLGEKQIILTGVGYLYDNYKQMRLFEFQDNPVNDTKLLPGEQRTYYISHKSFRPKKINSVIVIDTHWREYLYHVHPTLYGHLRYTALGSVVSRLRRKIKSLF